PFSIATPPFPSALRPSIARGRCRRPRRQEAHQSGEQDEWEDQQEERNAEPFSRCKLQLVGCVPQKALREKLTANHDVPPHREYPDQRENAREAIDEASQPCAGDNVGTGEQRDRRKG